MYDESEDNSPLFVSQTSVLVHKKSKIRQFKSKPIRSPLRMHSLALVIQGENYIGTKSSSRLPLHKYLQSSKISAHSQTNLSQREYTQDKKQLQDKTQIQEFDKSELRPQTRQNERCYLDLGLGLYNCNRLSSQQSIRGNQLSGSIHSYRNYKQIVQPNSLSIDNKQGKKASSQEKIYPFKSASKSKSYRTIQMPTQLKGQYQIYLKKLAQQDLNAVKDYFQQLEKIEQNLRKDEDHQILKVKQKVVSQVSEGQSHQAHLLWKQLKRKSNTKKAVDTQTLNKFSGFLKGIKF